MDIIIRDVEEKDGQYKIYNKDGTGGHWYISKESAEKINGEEINTETSFEEKLKIIKDNFMKRTSWLVIKHIDHKAIWSDIETDIRNNFGKVKKGK